MSCAIRQRLPWLACLTVLLLSQLAACGFSGDRRAAERVVEQYFAALDGRDVDAALALYSPGFFEKMPREEWRRSLEQRQRDLGAVRGQSLLSSGLSKTLGSKGGTRVQLVYSVNYERGETTETLVLEKSSDGEFRIAEHSIESEGRDLTPAPQETITV